jgi:tRNA (guanine37-N1)-methyltransferase
MLHVDVLTIFPEMFAPVTGSSILKQAQAKGLVQIDVHNLRDYTHNKRRTVDDRPYGGGPGMVMKPEPIFEAVEAIEATCHSPGKPRSRPGCQIVLTAPQGQRLTQALAQELSMLSHLVILCGHYEGVDERIRQALVDREISIGDYVLTGGELPAMVVMDCVVRLIPGVLGHEHATIEESFSAGLLEYPHYTRPPVFRGMAVPEVLRCGNHEQIATWRKLHALARTLSQRPDLSNFAKQNC